MHARNTNVDRHVRGRTVPSPVARTVFILMASVPTRHPDTRYSSLTPRATVGARCSMKRRDALTLGPDKRRRGLRPAVGHFGNHLGLWRVNRCWLKLLSLALESLIRVVLRRSGFGLRVALALLRFCAGRSVAARTAIPRYGRCRTATSSCGSPATSHTRLHCRFAFGMIGSIPNDCHTDRGIA